MQGVEAVLSEWKSRFGLAFNGLREFFVQGSSTPTVYPCPGCGSSLRIAEHPDKGALALHDDFHCCEDIQLSATDLHTYCLNMHRWLEKLCQALSIENAVQQYSGSIWRMGTVRIGRQRHPVYFLTDPGGLYMQHAMQASALQDQQAFIFSPRYCADTADWLRQKQHGYFPLSDHLEFDTLQPAPSYAEAWLSTSLQFAAEAIPIVTPDQVESIPAYLFRKAGTRWRVRFNRSDEFFINDTLGAKYLNYLFHHPNDPIEALALEVEVNPAKEAVRTKESIHKRTDHKARQQYEKRLLELVGIRESQSDTASEMERAEIEDEIDELTKLLSSEDAVVAADAGEKARGNVGKAITAVTKSLKKLEEPGAKALCQHIANHISKGYILNYNKAENITWT